MIKRLTALLNRIIRNKNTIDDMLLFTFLFAAVLLITRVGITGQRTFIFLIWNLMLAFLPYAITSMLIRKIQWIENRFIFIPVFLLWLSLIPNSFYIITDLFHLEQRKPIALWFDLLLLFSFVWNGLLLGILSMRQMEDVISTFTPKTNFVMVPVMFLNGLGIYIGRYLRFNSWDILTNPFDLAEQMINLFMFPVHYRYAWAMIIGFSFFLLLIYFSFKKLTFINQ